MDTLASRYGWTRSDCLDEMYWEDFWEHVIIASNFGAEEKNADLRFQFMLHADKKSASKWKDLPLPFPSEKEKSSKEKGDKGGVDQIPPHLRDKVVYRPDD